MSLKFNLFQISYPTVRSVSRWSLNLNFFYIYYLIKFYFFKLSFEHVKLSFLLYPLRVTGFYVFIRISSLFQFMDYGYFFLGAILLSFNGQ